MNITGKAGVEILRDHLSDIKGNHYFVLIFALITRADEVQMRQLIREAIELDAVTGKHCLFIVFYKSLRSRDSELYLDEFLRRQFLYSNLDRHMLSNSMTEESYKLAAELGISFERLPCLVVFDTLSFDREFRVISLNNVDSISILLREFMGEYYTHPINRQYFQLITNIEHLNSGYTALIHQMRRIEASLHDLEKKHKQNLGILQIDLKGLPEKIESELFEGIAKEYSLAQLDDTYSRVLNLSKRLSMNYIWQQVRLGLVADFQLLDMYTSFKTLVNLSKELGLGKLHRTLRSIELEAEKSKAADAYTSPVVMEYDATVYKIKTAYLTVRQLLDEARVDVEDRLKTLREQRDPLDIKVKKELRARRTAYITSKLPLRESEIQSKIDQLEKQFLSDEAAEVSRLDQIRVELTVAENEIRESKQVLQDSRKPLVFELLDAITLRNQTHDFIDSVESMVFKLGPTLIDILTKLAQPGH